MCITNNLHLPNFITRESFPRLPSLATPEDKPTSCDSRTTVAMTSLPIFSDRKRFPAFADCPVLDSPLGPDEYEPTILKTCKCINSYSSPYYLLGMIAENMTVSPSPTFILKDRDNVSFALTLRIPADEINENIPGGGLDVSDFKKRFTVVVEGAKRSGVKEGKAGFVVTPSGTVKVCSFLCNEQWYVKLMGLYRSFQPVSRNCLK